MPSAVRVRLLLEVGAVLLRVGSAKLAVAGLIALLADDGRRLRILMVLLGAGDCDDDGRGKDLLGVGIGVASGVVSNSVRQCKGVLTSTVHFHITCCTH